MPKPLESNKVKIAKRVIEVFEFFDHNNSEATVMDIARCYGRPQSSTSELLASLVEMGLLYRDSRSRCYTPTPRLATLGASAQPEIVRDGRLFMSMGRLSQATRCGVGLFGMVDTRVQLFGWSAKGEQDPRTLASGASDILSASAAGLLLLSTLGEDQTRRVLRRLNAEAPEDSKFNYCEVSERAMHFGRQGYAVGEAGFAPGFTSVAVLLPKGLSGRPLALGVIYRPDLAPDIDALVSILNQTVRDCTSDRQGEVPIRAPTLMAAL